MNPLEALRLAFSAVVANRLRSALTMLGITIGVGTVILLVAFGNGTSISVSQRISSLGADVITVFPSNQRLGGVSQGFGSGQTLTEIDVKALGDRAQAPDIAAVMPVAETNATLLHQDQNWQAQVQAGTEVFPEVRNYQLAAGSFFTAAQVTESARVVVLGETVVDNLFNGDPDSAVGQTLQINHQDFRVLGVFAPKGAGGFGNQDNVAVIPITAGWNYLLGSAGGKNISSIVLESTSSATVDAAESEATQILLASHHIGNPAQADFQLRSQQDIQQTFGQVTGVLTILLGAIAAISLVVGGIGIMNIMLVTVTERTREIGIRKAIGAKRSDVLLQFLIESMVLSGLGGLLGVLLGVGGVALIDQLTSAASRTSFNIAASLASGNVPPPVISLPSVLLAFGVSVGIGIFFGIYPANRAAALNPIEALRFE